MDKKVILIVEDDATIALLMQQVLNEQPGYRALSARTGHAALDVLEAAHVDLLVLDVNLPDLDGFTLHDRLRGRPETAALPCLFMSACDYREALARRSAGAFLPKPFALDTLLSLVGQALEPSVCAAPVAEPA
jgi:DNA-binding response OmpR family regulator